MDGVNRLAKAVAVTMGPKGRTVVIEQDGLATPKITKDGVTVARSVSFADRVMNLGAQLVRDVAAHTNSAAGDGTTTATVLANKITSGSFRAVASGAESVGLVKGINRAVRDVVAELDKLSTKVATKEQIFQVATVSANNNPAIGKLVSDAFERVGKDGIITIQDGKKMTDELEVIEGMNVESGYLSHYFVNDQKALNCAFANPLFLVCDHNITSATAVVPALQLAHQAGRPLVIVADNVDGDALTTLLLNKLRGLRVVAVRAPSFGEERRKQLEDIALMTGAKLFSEEVGDKIETVTRAQLGAAKNVTVSQNDTLILQGAGDRQAVARRCDELRHQLGGKELTEYERQKLKERLAKLSGGVAVIKVGGTSEAAVGEKKDRLEDALNACRAATREGVVPGGGVALLRAGEAVRERYQRERYTRAADKTPSRTSRLDSDVGEDIVIEATKAPLHAIAANAGKNGAVIEQKVLESKRRTFGYDANKDEFCDLVANGIIDPAYVVKTAFRDAAEISAVLATSACVITQAERKDRDQKPSLAVGYDE